MLDVSISQIALVLPVIKSLPCPCLNSSMRCYCLYIRVPCAAEAGRLRRRSSLASFSRQFDPQSSDERDDDSFYGSSRPSSFEHGQLAGTDFIPPGSVNANGSVPREAGADNNAFDAGTETTVETRHESGESAETRRADGVVVETVTAEVHDEAGACCDVATKRRPLSKSVSFIGLNDETQRNKDNSTEQEIISPADDTTDGSAGNTRAEKKRRFLFGKNKQNI